MTRLFQAAAAVTFAAALTACGSAQLDASNAAGTGAPMVFSSSHAPQAIAQCMKSRVSRADERTGADYIELGVGRSSRGYAWLVTLTPSTAGANVSLERAIDDDSVSEPELRYAIARCTT